MCKNLRILLFIFIVSIAATACGDEKERQNPAICTVETTATSTILRCPGEDDAVIPHGETGPQGEKGETGPAGGASTGGVDCSVGFFGDIMIDSDFPESDELTALIASGCTTIRGNVSIIYMEPPPVFEKITRIYGDLEIGGHTVGDLSFPALTTIDGNLDISGSPIFRTNSFPLLQKVGNSLTLTENLALETLDSFPSLNSIGNRFILARNSNLTTTGGLFDVLYYIGGDVYIENNHTDFDECAMLYKVSSTYNYYGQVYTGTQCPVP